MSRIGSVEAVSLELSLAGFGAAFSNGLGAAFSSTTDRCSEDADATFQPAGTGSPPALAGAADLWGSGLLGVGSGGGTGGARLGGGGGGVLTAAEPAGTESPPAPAAASGRTGGGLEET